MTTLTVSQSPLAQVLAFGAKIIRPVVSFAESVSKARAASNEVQHLMNLSDSELAAKGLTRQTIVHHAFREYLAD